MKDDKGFTLIEVMSVITILVILSLILVPIIDKNVKRAKNNLSQLEIENIRMAGMNYFSDNPLLKPDVSSFVSISLDDLIDLGYISGNVVDPKNGNSFDNLSVELKNDNGTYKYLVCPIEQGCSTEEVS